MTQLPFKDMNWLCLLEGPADQDVMDIAPTMKNLTVRGAKYFRMPDTRASKADSAPPERSGQGGCYLWADWAPWKKYEPGHP